MELVAAGVNARGGLLGRNVEVVVQDDGGDPRTASLAAQRLASKHVVAVIGTYGSSVTEAAQGILDEPSLGLSPLLVREIFRTLREINATGVTVLLVEQNARAALALAHRAYVLATGSVVLEGPAVAIRDDPAVRKAYLGG